MSTVRIRVRMSVKGKDITSLLMDEASLRQECCSWVTIRDQMLGQAGYNDRDDEPVPPQGDENSLRRTRGQDATTICTALLRRAREPLLQSSGRHVVLRTQTQPGMLSCGMRPSSATAEWRRPSHLTRLPSFLNTADWERIKVRCIMLDQRLGVHPTGRIPGQPFFVNLTSSCEMTNATGTMHIKVYILSSMTISWRPTMHSSSVLS
jgi:hypothetical protein